MMIEGSLTDEEYRVYTYTDGYEIRIDKPVTLFRPEGKDTHRVLDSEGLVTYIPAGWRKLQWKPMPDKNPVAF